MTPAGSLRVTTPRSSAMTLQTDTRAISGPAELDEESRAWVAGLRADGVERARTVGELHELLLRAARFEIARRRGALPHLRGDDFDDLAHQSANDALMAILAKLDDYRGESRFTTWAYKFALLEAAVKLRRRAWQGREVPIEPEHWSVIGSGGIAPDEEAEQSELLHAIQDAIVTELSPHQREVLLGVA